MNDRDQLHLNYFHFPTGAHEASWRHPDSDPASCQTLDYYVSLAQVAERACLDSFFVPGNHGVIAIGETDKALNLEPLLVMMAIAARTERIGLIGTSSTTFNQPWMLAKAFATLDHLSGGRAGWNVVTSSTDWEAWNFGLPGIPDHETRYAMAAEFVDVAHKLWSAWDDDALILDREAGVYADESKVHDVDHAGQYYSVKGALPIAPSPQRRPLMVQAGASPTGRAFAARYAEAVFCYAATLEDGRQLSADLKQRAESFGRSANEIKVMPGLAPIIGATEAEAKAKAAELGSLLMPEKGLSMIKAYLHLDLAGVPLDAPVPPLPDPSEFAGSVARLEMVRDFVERENATVRDLANLIAVGGGCRVIVGTAEQIADSMEEWFTEGAADGFNLMAPVVPSGLEEIADQLVPELQRRGLFRAEYAGRTLREHYGLPLRAPAVPA